MRFEALRTVLIRFLAVVLAGLMDQFKPLEKVLACDPSNGLQVVFMQHGRDVLRPEGEILIRGTAAEVTRARRDGLVEVEDKLVPVATAGNGELEFELGIDLIQIFLELLGRNEEVGISSSLYWMIEVVPAIVSMAVMDAWYQNRCRRRNHIRLTIRRLTDPRYCLNIHPSQ